MEAIFVPCSPDQSISPYKQMKNTKKSSRAPFRSNSSENLAPTKIHGGGHFFAPPPPSLSFSYSSSPSLLNNPLLYHHNYQQIQHQPPLLPLPIPKPHSSNLPYRSPSHLSCLPPAKKSNLTPKKSKQSPRKKNKPTQTTTTTTTTEPILESVDIGSATDPLGPDPNELPKDVSRVLSSSSSFVDMEDLEKFSGSVYTLSPHPSSLPLPKFSVRPKLSCNAEAAGIDAGATDNLRRLLRLR